MKTAKSLFPGAKIWVQSIPPFHPRSSGVTDRRNICAMNDLIFNRCSQYKIFYLDVFWAFLDRSGDRNDKLFPGYGESGRYDIHPSKKVGMPVLARFYLHLIHSKWFNPVGY